MEFLVLFARTTNCILTHTSLFCLPNLSVLKSFFIIEVRVLNSRLWTLCIRCFPFSHSYIVILILDALSGAGMWKLLKLSINLPHTDSPKHSLYATFSISKWSLMPVIHQACQFTHLAKRLMRKIGRRQRGEDSLSLLWGIYHSANQKMKIEI